MNKKWMAVTVAVLMVVCVAVGVGSKQKGTTLATKGRAKSVLAKTPEQAWTMFCRSLPAIFDPNKSSKDERAAAQQEFLGLMDEGPVFMSYDFNKTPLSFDFSKTRVKSAFTWMNQQNWLVKRQDPRAYPSSTKVIEQEFLLCRMKCAARGLSHDPEKVLHNAGTKYWSWPSGYLTIGRHPKPLYNSVGFRQLHPDQPWTIAELLVVER